MALALLPAGGCAGPRRLMAPTGGDYTVARDIPYGEGPRRRLDVYRPAGATGAPRPLIVYYYGGVWTNGAKDDAGSTALVPALVARGAVVVVPDYRLYPETGFPGFVEDGAAAAAWARGNAAGLGADPRLVFLAGHSSGGHMAVLLGTDRRFLDAAGFGAAPPAGLIGISGAYEPEIFALPFIRPMFASAADPREVLPATHLGPAVPPMLLLSGSLDWMVPPRNTTRLAAAVREAGGAAEARVYPGVGHFDILAIGPLLPSLSPTADDIAGFVRQRTAAILGG